MSSSPPLFTAGVGHGSDAPAPDALRVAGGIRLSTEAANASVLGAEVRAAEAIARLELGDPGALNELAQLVEAAPEPMFCLKVLSSAVLVEARLDQGSIGAAREAFEQAGVLTADEALADGAWTWLAEGGDAPGTCFREIADELYISQNSLKFHLKVIYRKLGVSSRAEASAIARRLLTAC